jgi:ribosomal protein L2
VRKTPGIHDVVRIEFDPGRSAHIALIRGRNESAGTQIFSYILAPEGLRAGDTVQSFRMGIPDDLAPEYALQQEQPPDSGKESSASTSSVATDISLAMGLLRSMTVKPGNVLPLKLIPHGTLVHNISLKPEGRGILVRSAGSAATIVAHTEGNRYVQVRLQSGEIRKVLQDCCATIGAVSNPLWKDRSLGKAGRNRWLGHRPKVRGVAMNKYIFSFLCSRSLAETAKPGSTILMEADVVNQNPTSTLCLFGAGRPKGNGRASRVLKVPRTVTKWLSRKGLAVKRRLANASNVAPAL